MISPGTFLQNRYRVVRQIGQGGMGTVYVATDERFRSTVALKETHFDEPGLRRAFEREAHLLHRLRHAALPKVTDHFVEGAGQFLVMEFIPGEDLSEMLRSRGGAFDLKDVSSWADQLLDALDYLHTQDTPVVHRDIKPQNLKLTSRNQIVLLDFGLAKGSAAQLTRVTATGSVFGYSRHYAPLEQIQGAGTDPRSDLYSLAATLYHLLTAAPPPDALTRATAVLNGQPDPLSSASELNPQIPAPVSEVLARAMSLNASQRPQTAAEMRDLLRAAATRQEFTPARASGQPPPPPNANTFPDPGGLFNQQTRLMNPSGGSTDAPADPLATRRLTADDAATVVGQSGLTNNQQPGTRAAAANAPPADMPATNVAAPGVASASAGRGASVLTQVRPVATATKRRTGLVVAAAAAFLMFAAGAAALYNFTRDTPRPNAPARVAPQANAPAAALPA
ncbi:MAG TPA: serine/threonine-protein kinase, partial [Pyrinomonadaceae bacterium]|nr:serine/threonine-protein kinase [Pyrinomonadaceae bacterium]